MTKSYKLESVTIDALLGVSLVVAPGDYVAVTGPSGSGKSTLMHLLGGLDRPTNGTVRLGGRDVATMDDDAIAQARNMTVGFVFQSFALLPRTSALGNVGLPLVYRGVGGNARRARAADALAAVGMTHRLGHRPSQLSGGEQQRVAIARALVGDPLVVLADEPTGNLDSQTGEDVMATLESLNRERGVAVVVVTHDSDIAARARRRVQMRDGVIVNDVRRRTRVRETAARGVGVPAARRRLGLGPQPGK
ncbi:MAG: ABC transporter ATP-binding protein [Mycobacteriales bacterium]|nr:ABC transporter ATP-binding protein [Frankia sp.]